MKACKHLDYSDAYSQTCILRTIIDNKYGPIQYWERQNLPYPEAPRNVQFCGQGRGRINGILQCYVPGEMSCYEPAEDAEPAGEDTDAR